LLFLLADFILAAQTPTDSTNKTQIATERTHGPQTIQDVVKGDFEDNRYGPFHWTIRDTMHRTVSKFGHYISVGIGSGHEYQFSGASALFSYSLAYKSLVFSVTRCGSSVLFNGGSDRDINYSANYLGFLIGESFRLKNLFISLSTGIASANIYLSYPNPSGYPRNRTDYTNNGIISIPIEFKFFLLARNGIGIGIHFSDVILSPSQYSPSYFGFAIVFGGWNKSRSRK